MPRFPEFSQPAGAMPSSIFARLLEKLPADRSGIFPFHLGDTHLAPPERSRLGAVSWDETAGNLYSYGAPAGDPALVDALVTKLARKNGLPATAANIQITAGATHAFSCAVRALLDPHDEILLLAPYWPLIRGHVLAAGARPVEVPFYSNLYEEARAPREILREWITPRTAAIYVTTPNNPDGKVLTAEELASIAELAREANLWVLADEVYEDYIYSGRPHLSIATLPGMFERTLTVFSFSKSYGQAGLRVGYVVGPAGAIAPIRKLANHSVFNVPNAMQRAARHALEHGDAFLAAARAEYHAARDLTVAALETLQIPHHVPEGGSYVFLKLPVELEELASAGILLAPGEAFGKAYAGWARFCYTAVPRDRLAAGLAKIAGLLTRG